MVAASAARSQVPPDDLQATPGLALRPFSTEQLGKSLSVLVLESQPRDAAQHNAASYECCPKPTTIAGPYLDVTVMLQAQAIATPVPCPNDAQIAHIDAQPGDRSQAAHRPRDWQQQEHDATDAGRDQPGE